MSDYPAWICSDCGRKYGRVLNDHCVTFHEGDKCGWCGKETITTEPRDYGYPRARAAGDTE
jgi:DNA-directed RNA polymerase subunit RPC12/RpoP